MRRQMHSLIGCSTSPSGSSRPARHRQKVFAQLTNDFHYHPTDDTKLHKAETFNGFDSSSSKSSLSPPNVNYFHHFLIKQLPLKDSTSTTATEMAMTITMLRKQFAALLEHQNELNGKLLLANQYAGFRGSRGVLEAEQARLQRMYTDQQKELEDETRRNGEEKLRVEKERREVEQRKARLEEREQVCDKSEKDLRKKV